MARALYTFPVCTDCDDDASQTRRDGRVLLYLARDLFFGLRIRHTAERAGWTCVALNPDDDPAAVLSRSRPNVVLADLLADAARWRALVTAARHCRTGSVPCVAFGSHMDLQVRAEALEAGATAVVANSQIAANLVGILDRYAPTTPATA